MTHWNSALRSLVRRPAFTVTAVAVLAFGIGANSALFSVVDTVLLKPLPYAHSDRLVRVMEANAAKSERISLVSPAHLDDWNRLSHTFAAITGVYSENVTDTSMTEPARLAGRRVTTGYFKVFEMRPLAGRTFVPAEEQFGGPKAAVIREGLWTRRYARDAHVTGKRLILAGEGYTIVGVMPAAFAAPSIDVWLPAQLGPGMLEQRDARFLSGFGRLKPGITIAQAAADIRRVCARLAEQYPRTDKGWSALIEDLKQVVAGGNTRALTLMFGATALLLLILCANIAGLLLGYVEQREREFAIRASLGATRTQIAAVVFREVAILSIAGGALGLALAVAGSRILAKAFADLPRMNEMRFDWRIVLFTLGASAITALMFGLAPALQATRRGLNAALARGGRSQAGGRHRVQQTLVCAQFAVTLVLLAGAGLLLRSYYNLTHVQPGFRAANVVTFHVGAEWGEDREKVGVMQRRILTELQRLPGVRAAGFTNFLPASEATLREQVWVEGLAQVGENGKITAGTRSVTDGYLRALHMPLLKGSFCPVPQPLNFSAPGKVLVNRRFLETSGGADLIGRTLRFGSFAYAGQIIGVLGDVDEDSLNTPAVPYVYLCIALGAWPDPEYVAAVNGGVSQFERSLPAVIHRIAPGRAVFGVTTLAEYLDRTLDKPRLDSTLLGVFAASALLAAAVGLYGFMALLVAGRTREIGVRMALGARPAQILRHVAIQALRPVLIATAIGFGAAMLTMRAFRSVLFDVAPGDALTFAIIAAVLIVVALAAVVGPARRAARVDPGEALRAE